MIALLSFASIWRAIWTSEIPRIVKDELVDELEHVGGGLRPLVFMKLLELKAEREQQDEDEDEENELLIRFRDPTGAVDVVAAHRIETLGHEYRASTDWHCIHCGKRYVANAQRTPCEAVEHAP